MNQDIKTLELAKVYETQGYYKDAFDIYSFLKLEQNSETVEAGLKRMEKKMAEEAEVSEIKDSTSQSKKISLLLEKWLNLIILKQRLNNFKKIKSLF